MKWIILGLITMMSNMSNNYNFVRTRGFSLGKLVRGKNIKTNLVGWKKEDSFGMELLCVNYLVEVWLGIGKANYIEFLYYYLCTKHTTSDQYISLIYF